MADNTPIVAENDAVTSKDGSPKPEAFPKESQPPEMVAPEELQAKDFLESSNSDREAPSVAKSQVIAEPVNEDLERQTEHGLTSRQDFAFGDFDGRAIPDDSAKLSSQATQADRSSGASLAQQGSIHLEDSRTDCTEPRQSAVPVRSRWKRTAAVLVVAAALLGGLVLHRHRSPDTRPSGLSSMPTRSMPAELPQDRSDFSQADPLDETPATPQATPEDTPQAWLQAASQLIDILSKKRHEIIELQHYYQSGVREIETDIVFETDEKGIATFDQALKDKRIELGLRTIQRRQVYIRQLDQPCQWIEQGIEELQYLRHKTMIDRDMLSLAEGIDMDTNLRHLSAAIQKYQPEGEKLAVVVQNADLPPLKIIWEDIRRHDNAAVHREVVEPEDLQVWQEICSGNLEELATVRRLSTDAAICISKMKGGNLFLNNLSQLSPSAARHLFEWKGDWICLNGFKNLPPVVAKYLFQWQGKIISLNSLIEFSPELGKLLLTWKGRQIELMGLRDQGEQSESTGLSYLAQWERSGGKVFVPESIREKMETLE